MLELKEVTKKFGDRTILDHVDLTVEDGKILCIVGQSGASAQWEATSPPITTAETRWEKPSGSAETS